MILEKQYISKRRNTYVDFGAIWEIARKVSKYLVKDYRNLSVKKKGLQKSINIYLFLLFFIRHMLELGCARRTNLGLDI